MNNPIHVQVQVVELRQQCIVGDNLIYLGISLGNPTIELQQDEVSACAKTAILTRATIDQRERNQQSLMQYTYLGNAHSNASLNAHALVILATVLISTLGQF
jgi:hypothetical protein